MSVNDYLHAAVLSHDRYGGAMQASEIAWASKQAGAYMFYLNKSGLAMKRTADALDRVVAALEAEGYTVIIPDPEQFRAYQQRLAASGFTDEEREAAAIAGLDGESVELVDRRQVLRCQRTLSLARCRQGGFEDREEIRPAIVSGKRVVEGLLNDRPILSSHALLSGHLPRPRLSRPPASPSPASYTVETPALSHLPTPEGPPSEHAG